MEKIKNTLENSATALGPAILAGYHLLEHSDVGS